jgi:hypothetical protein
VHWRKVYKKGKVRSHTGTGWSALSLRLLEELAIATATNVNAAA